MGSAEQRAEKAARRMEAEMNTAIKKPMLISNIINSVYLALLTVVGVGFLVIIRQGEQMAGQMVDQALQADAESYMGGYQLIGNMMGAGAVSLFLLALYILIGITVIYWLLFLGENISGYVIYSRLGKRADGQLGKSPKVTFILKCVLSVLVILPTISLLYTEQWVTGLVILLPQAAVLGLSVMGLRALPHWQAEPAADLDPGF